MLYEILVQTEIDGQPKDIVMIVASEKNAAAALERGVEIARNYRGVEKIVDAEVREQTDEDHFITWHPSSW